MRKLAKSQLTREQLQVRYTEYRLKVLPDQLERARLRYIHLCREAQRMGMTDILTPDEMTL